MEDQQPDPGDLTALDEAVAARGDNIEATPTTPRRRRFFRRRSESVALEQNPAEPVPAASQLKTPVGKAARAAKASEPEPNPPSDQQPEANTGEVTLVPHRPAGSRFIAAVISASVLVVAAAAFAGAAVQPYLSQRALVETKLDIARTATNAITTLWTYTPDDMATLANRASRYLTPDFADEYRKYIDAIIEPNKQAKVTNTTEVKGAAVESVSPAGVPTEATALVYTNSVATSPVTKNIPSLRYLSYRLTMKRDGGDWLITRMSTITSFDLTPQL